LPHKGDLKNCAIFVCTEKNGFVTATKLGTTSKFFVATTKNFAAATKRFVDRTKHFVVTKSFFIPILTHDFVTFYTVLFPLGIPSIKASSFER